MENKPRITKIRVHFLKEENQRKAINLMNSGFSFNYIAKVFRCKPETVKKFRRRKLAEGIFLKDMPKDGGIQPENVGRHGYVRLFRFQENTDKAIELIRLGFSYSDIGIVLGCDRTSVMSFHRRKIRDGVDFGMFDGQRSQLKKRLSNCEDVEKTKEELLRDTIKFNNVEEDTGEIINQGKSYEEYLEDYKKEISEIQKERMEKAKEVIEGLRKWRKENNINVEKDWTLGRL